MPDQQLQEFQILTSRPHVAIGWAILTPGGAVWHTSLFDTAEDAYRYLDDYVHQYPKVDFSQHVAAKCRLTIEPIVHKSIGLQYARLVNPRN